MGARTTPGHESDGEPPISALAAVPSRRRPPPRPLNNGNHPRDALAPAVVSGLDFKVASGRLAPPQASAQTGRAGVLRLFSAPLSKEASWLLPLALWGALLLLRGRLSWPIASRHQALVLWGGWLLIAGIFFSVAGFFHEYYLAMLASPVAALCGIGVTEFWRWRRARWRLALAALLGAVCQHAGAATDHAADVRQVPVVAADHDRPGGGRRPLRHMARGSHLGLVRASFACLVAALLITPAIWSWGAHSSSTPA